MMPSSFRILVVVALAVLLGSQSTARADQPDDIAKQNHAFAVRLKAFALREAAQAEANLRSRAAFAYAAADRATHGISQGSDLGLILDAHDKGVAPSDYLRLAGQNASQVADEIHSVRVSGRGSTPSVVLQELGETASESKLTSAFPELASQAGFATLEPIGVTGEPSRSFVSLYARTGVFSDGGPSIQFPSVGMLLLKSNKTGNFEPWCTATLVAPNKIITAAHCFCPEPNSGEVTRARCDAQGEGPDGEGDPKNFWVFFQTSGLFRLQGFNVNPAYELGSDASNKPRDIGDVAVGTLTADVINFSFPASLADGALGASAQIVGFGAGFAPNAPGVSAPGATPSPPGLKLWASVGLASCGNPFSPGVNLCWASGPGSGNSSGAICPGDSGGPMFAPPSTPVSEGALIGVNSAAITKQCEVTTLQGDTNLEDVSNEQFIKSQIGAPPAPVTSITYYPDPLDMLDTSGATGFSIHIDRPLKALIVAANGFSRSNLSVGVTDAAGQSACAAEGGPANKLPSVSVCRISNVSAGATYEIHLYGSSEAAYQALVTGTPQ